MGMNPLQPECLIALENPAFLQHLREQFPEGPIEPDGEDFQTASPRTTEAHQYRLARAMKLKRMWSEWKASQPRPALPVSPAHSGKPTKRAGCPSETRVTTEVPKSAKPRTKK
jgi:hypothetical protein